MRLTDEQRAPIIAALMDGHYLRANRIAEEYGLGKNYVKNLRFRLGLPLMRKKLPEPVKQEDPRWQWAISRGAISR